MFALHCFLRGLPIMLLVALVAWCFVLWTDATLVGLGICVVIAATMFIGLVMEDDGPVD